MIHVIDNTVALVSQPEVNTVALVSQPEVNTYLYSLKDVCLISSVYVQCGHETQSLNCHLFIMPKTHVSNIHNKHFGISTAGEGLWHHF